MRTRTPLKHDGQEFLVCSKCGRETPINMIESHTASPVGRGSRCLDCKRMEGRRNQSRLRAAGLVPISRSQNYPQFKVDAKNAVWHQLQSGKIKRPAHCSDCGIECIPHGHHPDYHKSLDVVWLCVKCHNKRHRKPSVHPSCPAAKGGG